MTTASPQLASAATSTFAPVVHAEVAGLLGFLHVAVHHRQRLRDQPVVRRVAVRQVVLCGLCDAGANALFLASVNRGLLSLVAVLAALYPASTVVLAWLVLRSLPLRSAQGCRSTKDMPTA